MKKLPVQITRKPFAELFLILRRFDYLDSIEYSLTGGMSDASK